MPTNRLTKWGGGLVLFLILANIVSYFYSNWGLITVKVQDAPLSKVVKSIEWQGWVKIYTNLPPDTKVTMFVDHVPLAEAMETLAANVGGPPVGAERRDRGDRGPNGNGPGGGPPGPDGATPGAQANNAPSPGGSPTGPGGTPPDAQANNTNTPAGAPPGGFAGGGPGAGGPPGGGRGGRGGGGFGGGFGGAQWNLAFFVAPSSAQVKAEIQAFESGTTDDDTRVYTYPTPLQFVASDFGMPASDPRLQNWPGYKAPDPAAAAAANPPPDGQTPPPAPAADTPPNLQTYLQAFAESSNIWIMTPASWTPDVTTPPPANSSIISAVKNFISNSHGAVTQAIVLRVGRGARGGGGNRGGGGFADMEAMQDRLRNAINGLPEDAKPDALNQLEQEVQFYQQVKAAPQEQQQQMMRDHMMNKMANADNSRRSPEKRAARYGRAVSAREAVKGG